MEFDDIEKLIKSICKDVTADGEDLYFSYENINIRYNDETKKFYVDKSFFSKAPHVMRDGSVCFFGNANISINESLDRVFIEKAITVYIPWIIYNKEDIKVLEILGELDYYIPVLKGIGTDIIQEMTKTDATEVCISNPRELWEVFSGLNDGRIYYIFPINFKDYGVYVQYLKVKNKYNIDYQHSKKARQRVIELDSPIYDLKSCFIGIGSVNSYMIKTCLMYGMTKLTIIDNDKFEVGNAYRFAFPYKNKSKIDCVSKFCSNFPEVNVKKHGVNIEKNTTKDYLEDNEIVYVSVDSFESWFYVFFYLNQFKYKMFQVVLLGIDVFGGYGKYIRFNCDDEFVNNFIDFLCDEKAGKRKNMIPNGCGKSLAIYNESSILKLCSEAFKSNEIGVVKYVEF